MPTRRFAFPSLTRPLLLATLLAACALPLLPVQAGDSGVTVNHSRQAGDGGAPFALVQGNGSTITCDDSDKQRVKALKRSVQGDFLWFRDGGKEYIVQDPATLKRIADAWAPMKALGAEMGGQGAEMGRHGASMGALGAKMALAAVTFDGDKMEAIGKEMEDAGKPMEESGKKMEAIGKRMEAMQERAERNVRVEIAGALRNGTAKPVTTRG